MGNQQVGTRIAKPRARNRDDVGNARAREPRDLPEHLFHGGHGQGRVGLFVHLIALTGARLEQGSIRLFMKQRGRRSRFEVGQYTMPRLYSRLPISTIP